MIFGPFRQVVTVGLFSSELSSVRIRPITHSQVVPAQSSGRFTGNHLPRIIDNNRPARPPPHHLSWPLITRLIAVQPAANERVTSVYVGRAQSGAVAVAVSRRASSAICWGIAELSAVRPSFHTERNVYILFLLNTYNNHRTLSGRRRSLSLTTPVLTQVLTRSLIS